MFWIIIFLLTNLFAKSFRELTFLTIALVLVSYTLSDILSKSIYSSICSSIYPSVYPSMFIHLFIHPSIYLSICLSIYILIIHVYTSIHASVHTSIYLCPFIHPSKNGMQESKDFVGSVQNIFNCDAFIEVVQGMQTKYKQQKCNGILNVGNMGGKNPTLLHSLRTSIMTIMRFQTTLNSPFNFNLTFRTHSHS